MTDTLPTYEIKVGDLIKNNDKRKPDEIREINVVTPYHVGYHSGARQCYISRTRIFSDGYKRSWGWNVIF